VVNADAGVCTYTKVGAGWNVVGTDNCSATTTYTLTGATLGSGSSLAGVVFNQGVTTVTWSVTDGVNPAQTCSYTVTVNDTQLPVISCAAVGNQLVNTNAGVCTYTKVGAGWNVVGTDNCSATTTYTLTGATVGSGSSLAGVVFNNGVTTVTWSVTDGVNPAQTCSYTVTVNDIENPTITCPSNVVQVSDAGVCTALVNIGIPLTGDNCSVSSVVNTFTGTNNATGTYPLGLTNVTYTVTDGSGNTATCSFTVTINDTENPTITCPLNIIQSNDAGVCSAMVNIGIPLTGDNCSVSSVVNNITGTNDASGIYNEGLTNVTYTVTDGGGNTATCSFTVTINDTENPIANCQNITTYLDNSGNTSIIANQVDNLSTDNCGINTLTIDINSFTCGNVGANAVTLTVLDIHGNQSTCISTVTVIDTIKPIVTCSNLAQVADLGSCTALVNIVIPNSDACGIATLTNTFNGTGNATDNYPVGVTNVDYIVTDVNGNSQTCSFTVTVTDVENPTINCPLAGTNTINSDAGVCTYTQNGLVWNATGLDNCSAVTYNYTLTGVTTASGSSLMGQIFNLGNTTVNWTVTDGSGNTATCSYVISVIDAELPIITCPANMTVNNTVGFCYGQPVFSLPVVSDNCSIVSLIQTSGMISGANFPIGTTTQSYTVTDGSGNQASCSYTITVVDNQIPSIICPANITAFSSIGTCSKVVNFANPIYNDNCVGYVLTHTAGLNSGSSFPTGVTTETYVVTDASGNTNTCSFTITINDAQVPTITCPSNIVTANSNGQCGAIVNFTTPIGIDNCPGAVTALTVGLPTGSLFPLGTTTETYVVTDASGNTATCSFTIKVNDTELPQIVCPANINISNDLGVCGAVVNFVSPVGTDNCPGANTIETVGLPTGSTFPIGTTTETFKVTDAVGNIATCTFTITVNDTENPNIICQGDTTVPNTIGFCNATVNFQNVVVTDNCSGSFFTQSTGLADGAVFPLGTTTETFVGHDIHGNTATCTFNVTVIDTELPVINCPSNVIQNNDPGLCSAIVNYLAPVGTDNCIIANTSQIAGQASNTSFNVGTTINTYQVMDGAGNINTCSFTVQINDVQPPVISCPADTTIFNVPSQCYADINYAAPTAVDNCGISSIVMTIGLASGSMFPLDTTLVTFVATDVNGLTAQCTFNVYAVDTEIPVIACPSDILDVVIAGTCGNVATFITPSPTDNCSIVSLVLTGLPSGSTFPAGITTETYTVTDASGNVNTCSFNVNIIDNELPTINCPNGPNGHHEIVSTNNLCTYIHAGTAWDAIGTDNCSVNYEYVLTYNLVDDTIVSNTLDSQIFQLGTTLVTWSVTDPAGNQAFCWFNVDVMDNELPVAICPNDTTINNDLTMCSAVFNYPYPTITDNCSVVDTLFTGLVSGSVFPLGTSTQTFDVTDGSGNVGTCSFDVTVIDAELPIINCQADTTIYSDINSCSTSFTYTLPVNTDNCPGQILIMNSGLVSGSLFPVGTTTNVFTVTDGGGNTATCQFNVIVLDTVSPSIICPSDISDVVDPGTCVKTNLAFPMPLTNDNCSVSSVLLTAGLPSGSDFPAGSYVQTYTVTDASGNTNTCSFNIVIIDNQIPVIACAGIVGTLTVPTNTLCTYLQSGTVWDATATDNCTTTIGYTLTGVTTGTGTSLQNVVFNTGNTQVDWLVTDVSGNIDQCSYIINVIDTITPTITCPVNGTQIVSTNVGCTYVELTTAWNAIAVDNCSLTTTYTLSGATTGTGTNLQDSVFLPGNTLVNWVAVDASGNTSSCSFNVQIDDSIAPTIVCNTLGTLTVNTDPTFCRYENLDPLLNATATDNCSIISLVATLSGSTIDVTTDLMNEMFQKGNTLVTWTATDGVGNTSSCSFNVNVIDNETPVITCNYVDTLNVFVDATLCNNTNTNVLLDPTITDNCFANGVYTLTGVTTGTGATLMNVIFNHGVTRIDWVATDSSGNSSTCAFYVNVIDNEAPIVLPVLAPISFECTVIPPSVIDNCDNVITGTTTTVFTQGVFNVTWTFVDLSGNTSTATQVVTVDDITAPVTPILADILAECSATASAPDALDNCIGNVTGTTLDPITYTTQGTHVITWSFDDGNGNISTTTQNIIINDITAPSITAPIDVQIMPNNNGCTAINVDLGTPIFTDNCTVDTVYNDGLVTYPQGNTTVTWTVIDENGNQTTTTQVVTVLPITSTITPAPVCDSYTAPDNAVYTTSGVYTAVIPSVYGCDSTITINLTVNHSTTSIDSIRACETYTSPSGLYTWINSGTYMDTIQNVAGCDSIMTIVLTIDRMPSTNIVTLTNNQLFTALADTVEYQWINCDNGFSWENAIQQTFTPEHSGNYAVILTNHTCVDTSLCMPIGLELIIPQVISPNGDGINDKLVINGIHDYPNNVLKIFNRWGNLVYESSNYQNDWDGKNIETFTIGGTDLPVGTYFYVLDLGKEGNTPEQNIIKGYVYLTK
ncbi:MAG: HYR domain-containing protein, partial [Flavobacteriia bacterium]|nr:HYR domain-containing protein [Flavobacteriia bacterium]